jgi:hypothetical protein
MSLWSRLMGKRRRSGGPDAGASSTLTQGKAAPIVADPYTRGFDKDFRLPDDPEYVVRINQHPPKGLRRKFAEFVAVAGIGQPEAVENARGFIAGLGRRVELVRIPNHAVDPNAIAVIGYWVESAAVRTGRLGYLPADIAASIAREGPAMPIGATLEVMYAPTLGRHPGLRLDIWTSRRKVVRAAEQPYDPDVPVPSDPVDRNLVGKELEAKGLVNNAIECYESNARDGFEGNHPYDRLAVIFRRRADGAKEIAVLKRAVEVFERLLQEAPRSDVAPKLEAFRTRLRQAEAKARCTE